MNALGDPDTQVKEVRDIVKREVFDFNTRYDEEPTLGELAHIEEVTLNICFALWNY